MEDPRPLARVTDTVLADWMDEQEASAGYVPIHIYEESNRVTIHAFSQNKACLMKVVYHRPTGERTVERFDVQSGEMMNRRTNREMK
ncbi:hypothetical protein C772_00820 [Bhargavaea cecembensis DSE10]|uniref:Uncharacterized protein n=1 Tax=Bhargavaea cecembensis DSE10 TaxID=1235279 RepID=M7NZS3_9BACL|nr:hypothetical protein [Bhargavaea cecembensis]EMR07175.1 hypothetical protein C772_00820 [Bhargavaea cecembensis DSE10]